jgi:hypothetical protein
MLCGGYGGGSLNYGTRLLGDLFLGRREGGLLGSWKLGR